MIIVVFVGSRTSSTISMTEDRLKISSLLSVYKALWVKGKQTVQEWKIDEFNVIEQKNLGITRIFLMKDLFKIRSEGTTNPSSFIVFVPVSPSTCSAERAECVALKIIVSEAKGSECCCPPHTTGNTSSYQRTPRSPLNFWWHATSLSLNFVGYT